MKTYKFYISAISLLFISAVLCAQTQKKATESKTSEIKKTENTVEAISAAQPTIEQLLDKYTKALDSTQSFISEWENTTVGSNNIPSWGMRKNNAKTCKKGQYRTDNKGRSYEKSYRWGYVNALSPDASEDNAIYIMRVTGVKFTYSHNRHLGTQHKGQLRYREKGKQGWDSPERKAKGYFDRNETNNLFLGYVQTKDRLDRALKSAKRISVRQKPEIINGSLCYVIEANTRRGRFTVWLDSEHGYHPARIKAFVGKGDDIGDPNSPRIITAEDGITRRYTLDNVRFEKVDDIWVPMEADRTHYIVLGSPEKFSSGKSHFKRIKIELNPDHEALKSFADPLKNPGLDPVEIKNGAVVYLGDGIRRTWRDGKIK